MSKETSGFSGYDFRQSIAWGWRWRAGAGSAGEMPFWLHSNRLGAMDRYHHNMVLNLHGSWKYRTSYGLDLSTYADLLLRGTNEVQLWWQEGYVQIGYRHYLLWVGRKQEYFGLLHPDLTSGTMDHSQNIRPMPKVVISTDGYQPIPGTRRIFYYNASLAHGWLDDHDYRFVDDVLLHQKTLYLRMFTEDAVVVPRIGLTHFAQWGGDSPLFGKAPITFRSFFDVFFALSSDSKELFEGGELSNAFQNHIGVYDFSGMFNIGHYKFGFSRQFYLEDAPSARFAAYWDGLWSAYIQLRPDPRYRWRREKPDDWQTEWKRGERPFLTGINYEHLNTKNQLTRDPRRDKERYANYYNHTNYLSGWTYHGRVIGNPLYYSREGFYGVANNKLVAHHVGLTGFAGPFAWKWFTTYSRNYGAQRTYRIDDLEVVNQFHERRDQWSFLLEIRTDGYLRRELRHGPPPRRARPHSGQNSIRQEYSGHKNASSLDESESHMTSATAYRLLKNLPMWLQPSEIRLSLALDRGDVYPSNFGLMITLGWNNSTR